MVLTRLVTFIVKPFDSESTLLPVWRQTDPGRERFSTEIERSYTGLFHRLHPRPPREQSASDLAWQGRLIKVSSQRDRRSEVQART